MSAPKHKHDAYRPSNGWELRRKLAMNHFSVLPPDEQREIDVMAQRLADDAPNLGRTGALEVIQAVAELLRKVDN